MTSSGSRLLSLLALLGVLERLVPDVANYLYYVEMRAAYHDSAALAAGFAAFAQWTNLASFGAGVLVSTWLLRVAGLEWSLASSAVPNLVGMAAYALHPCFAAAIGFNGVEGTFRYSVFKAGKETAYTAAPRRVLYPVKGHRVKVTIRAVDMPSRIASSRCSCTASRAAWRGSSCSS